MLTDKAMHERMQNGWRGGKPFTICGNGSLPDNTAKVREYIPDLVRRYFAPVPAFVNDAGAGDLQWLNGMDVSSIRFRHFDLIPRDPLVKSLDITAEVMPPCDLILCRMVLNHLDEERIERALTLFGKSSALLLATQFDEGTRPFHVDLRRWLGDPVESTPDGNEEACTLALFTLG
jgi:hypothetical protein